MSPCPSLYGNWRPTSGTSSIQETTRRGKAARVSKMMKTTNDEEIEGARKKGRGRPPTIIKSAVKENMLPEFVERASEVLQQNGGSMDSNLFGQHWKQVHPNNPITSYKSVKGVTIHQMLRENLRFFEVSDTTRHKVKFFQLKPEAVTEYLQECKAREAQIKSSALVDKMAQAVRGAVESIDADAGQDSLLSVSVTADNAKKEHDVVSGALELAEGDSARPTDADADMVVHDYVPMQGKARLSSGFDRRRRAPTTINKEKKSLEAFREELPQAPTADDRDAVANPTVELYNSWAMDGRDVVMEVTHAAAFEEMWEHVTQEKLHPKHQFTAIDAGCGNGWAARKIAEHPLCESVIGIDAAAVMVDRAQHLSPAGDDVKISYSIGNVAEWAPEEEVDLVNLCESLYMFEDPQAALDNIVPKWLKPGGLLVANLDCYWENKLSHAWEEDLGVKMHCLSEKDWEAMFQAAGLTDVKRWRSKSNGPWQGTLLITGQRKQ
jgi:SAM-dependent methyltransferase